VREKKKKKKKGKTEKQHAIRYNTRKLKIIIIRMAESMDRLQCTVTV
jgi:hypothetical protein